jgi:DNA-binding HxlR family transcriptional regulator
MALLDLLGRRWALRVLWELRDGSATFRDLQERCDNVSPTVLNDRLRELRETGILELVPGDGYQCTTHGRALVQALAPLHTWAEAWGNRERRRGVRGSVRA